MISVSLPKEDVTIGQGINNTLKSFGQAVGPVIATAVMTSYSQPFSETINGASVVVSLPTATAFNIIFVLGIISTLVVIGVAATAKNYVLKKNDRTATPKSLEEQKSLV